MNTQMRKFLRLAVLTLLAVMVMGCGGAASNEVQLADADNGGQVSIKPGQTINLRLEADPTTGFGWEVSQVDAQVLAQAGDKTYEEAARGKPVAGGGGWEVFHFNAQQKGETTLQLIYHRAWEKDTPPVKTYSIKIRIE